MHEPTLYERFLISIRRAVNLFRSRAPRINPDSTTQQASPDLTVDDPKAGDSDGYDDSWCYGITNANRQYLADPPDKN